jgi:hypothetical protein
MTEKRDQFIGIHDQVIQRAPSPRLCKNVARNPHGVRRLEKDKLNVFHEIVTTEKGEAK